MTDTDTTFWAPEAEPEKAPAELEQEEATATEPVATESAVEQREEPAEESAEEAEPVETPAEEAVAAPAATEEAAAEAAAPEPVEESDSEALTRQLAALEAQRGTEAEIDESVAALRAQHHAKAAAGEAPATKKRHPVLKALLIIVLCLVVVLGAGAGYLYYHDQQLADVIPDGVTFYNASFSGLNKNEVAPKVATILDGLSAQNINMQVGGIDTTQTAPVTVPVKNFVSFETTSIVDGITQARSKMSLIQRLRSDWLHQSTSHAVPLSYTVDQMAVTSAVNTLAKKTNTGPVDAHLALPEGKTAPVITPERVGLTIEASTTAMRLNTAIKAAVTEDQPQNVTVQAQIGQPKVTAASLSKTPSIVVWLSKKQMILFQGDTMVRTMVTATGAPQYATRPGDYFIGVKRYNPTWINPGDAWAKSMPKEIGPGPGNPLGPRAMNVDQRNSLGQIVDFGYRIHAGTTGGGAWSHGCLHLSEPDVLWLYDQVKVGTPVFIRP